MTSRAVLIVLIIVSSPFILLTLGFASLGGPYSTGQLVIIPAICLMYGCSFWFLTKPIAHTLSPYYRKNDGLKVLTILLTIFVASAFFPTTYVLTSKDIADASPFTAEWANVSKSIVYGMPFGMYYEFSEETFCCGEKSIMPHGVFFNLLSLVILFRFSIFLLLGSRSLTNRSRPTPTARP